MLSPSDIRPAVEEVLRSTGNSLASYQILDHLPEALRDQIIAERGMPGAGQGNRYTAASLVTDAVELLLPSKEAPYRVYLEMGDMTFTVAGQTIKPGNPYITFYRLPAPEVPSEITVSEKATPPFVTFADKGAKGTISKNRVPPNTVLKEQMSWFFRFLMSALVMGALALALGGRFWLWIEIATILPLSLYALYRNKFMKLTTKSITFCFLLLTVYTCVDEDNKKAQSIQSQIVSVSASPSSVETAKPAQKASPKPPISKEEQVRSAFAEAKSSVRSGKYEDAIQSLKKVQALAPDKVAAQITQIKRDGAASLTETAKQVRRKDPASAAELLGRAVNLGGKEAPRLAARVQRDLDEQQKENEKRAAHQQNIATYVETATNLSGVLGESVTDYADQFTDIKSDPSLVQDNDWRLKTAGKLAVIKLTCEQVRDLKTPRECADAQEKLRRIAKGTESYGDLMSDAITTLDVNTINSATRHLNQATETIPAFGAEIKALKKKYEIQ